MSHKDRRAVRRANRIAAVDQEKSKRSFRRVVIIIVACVFLAVECYILSFAKERYDYRRSVVVSDEMVINLSMISSALQNGNMALYDESITEFRANLDIFRKNAYVRHYAEELVEKLDNYSSVLTEDVDIILELLELRVATNIIMSTADDAINSDIDAVKVYYIRDDYTALRDGLEKIHAEPLKAIKEKLISLSDEMIKYSDNAAVCIGVCADNTLAEKQRIINDIASRYNDELNKIGEEISEKYNPNSLILDLGEYSKL